MKKYKILLFDLDDTLLDFRGDERRALKTVLENHGLFSGEDVIETYYNLENWQTFTLGCINSKTALTTRLFSLLKLLQVENTDEIIDEYYSLMLKSHKLIPGALKLLRGLKKEGYRIYLTTNGYPEFQYPRIKAARLMNLFDGIFISEEIDLRKPTPAFYRYVFNRIPESNRNNILVIGDAQTADVLGGINAGLDTCWYNPKGRTGRYTPTYEIKRYEELEKIL